MRKKKKSATPKQFEIIVSCLKHQEHLFPGSNDSQNNAKRRELWLQLTDVLNQNGPPVRKCKEWKITWSDYKYNLKRKLARDIKLRRKNYKKSVEKRLPFNKTERAVLAMLGLKDEETTQQEESFKTNVPQSLAHILPQNDAAGSDVEIVEDTIDNKESIVLCDDDILNEEPVIHSVDSLSIDEQVIEAPESDVNIVTSLSSALIAMEKTQQAILKESKQSNRQKNQVLSIKDDDILNEEPVIQSVESLSIDQQRIEAPECDVNVATSLSSALMAIEITQQAILKELKESNRQQNQVLSIKERLLTLEQDKFDETKSQNYEENKRAYTMIELRRKELELHELKLKGLCKQCGK